MEEADVVVVEAEHRFQVLDLEREADFRQLVQKLQPPGLQEPQTNPP
jgi:hypothetical protein